MKDLGELLQRLGVARIAAMAVVAIMLLGFFAFLIMRSTTPQMAPLYTGLTFEDSGAIVSELNTMGMPYELRGEGDTILIPRDQITTTRMTLAQSGLPQRGQVGYEIFDQQSALGATSFVQNINHVRALEGELARTISSLARVQSARVHLVLPERELFSRDMKQPSASIVLSVRGQLSSGEIAAVQHLVASAIEGLSPNAVSIVDDTGTLLASGNGTDETSVTAQAIEERVVGIENRMRTRIEELLASIVGAGRARVQVSAELDLNRSTVTSETFDPNSQVARSSQVRETEDQSTGAGNTGEVTVANELPGASENTGDGGSTQLSTTLEETTNYEISRTTETSVNEAGDIKRLSVAVVVDGVYTYDAQGNPIYEARSAEELDQITALVRTAMGFDGDRGDQVEVVNMQFAQRPDIEIGTAEPGLFDFTRDDLMKFAEMAITLLISLALMLFIMRPLVKKVLAPEAKPLALPPASAVEADEEDDNSEDLAAAAEAREAATQAWMEQAKSMGESQVKAIKMVGELVEDNPKQASLIVRDWLSSAA
ncbi:flagellar basal-body MS-ring/collar protein FliF [Pelagibacterium halotolerans]|uniref:flagellar basal-body MS-ring/collar protein FliF n=1 Tax=Pelagibacterium halotolerans TaxID=531813 RepID=UPI00384AC132